MINNRLDPSFFLNDVLDVAPALIGKTLARKFDTGETRRYIITETEAYRGEEDRACHASKGLTPRTAVMYETGGAIYVYFIYGMYWLLNFVTSEKGYPAAALIRGIEGFQGPGRVGRELQLDKSFYGENLSQSGRIWVEENPLPVKITRSKRIGVDYAGNNWAEKPWRFSLVR
ncbi:MAG: DNA-3-methyladenine glycosylase [Prolixibacteraceae bacterium]|nr:DNA-3-methyladenine glycosylase [Prolixibacteraceae bacterium]